MAPRIRPRRRLGLVNELGSGSGLGGSGAGTFTFSAFSSPTSISTLIVSSLRVGLFHLSDGTCKVRAGLIKAIQRGNLVVVGPGQGILGGNDFDVVGNTSLETVAGLVHFLLGDLDFISGRFQVQQSSFDFERNLVA